MKFQSTISLILMFFVFYSCNYTAKHKLQTVSSASVKTIHQDSLQNKLNENLHFIADSLLNDKALLLQSYIKKYQTDTCGIVAYEDSTLKSDFEGVKSIGDINGDKIMDTVFVIPSFNYCDDGDSYVFFDASLPRLYTDSYCCHPDDVFSVGDIDEDGISEIGQYYSSCSSHYKSLIVYSLKNNKWKEVGHSVFDQHYMNYDKPFSSYVRKVAKGNFEMLEKTDLTDDKTQIGKWTWIKFSM